MAVFAEEWEFLSKSQKKQATPDRLDSMAPTRCNANLFLTEEPDSRSQLRLRNEMFSSELNGNSSLGLSLINHAVSPDSTEQKELERSWSIKRR